MRRATIKDELTDEILYGPNDFENQAQLDAWLAVRLPQENRRIEKSEAQTLHGDYYASYLVEEVFEEIDGADVTISVLKPLAKVESSDVSAEYTAEAAKLARREAGRVARLKCLAALDIIAGWNLERELTIEQISTMQTTFGVILQTLQANRPDSAKALIQDVVTDDILVTQEMKDEILSVL